MPFKQKLNIAYEAAMLILIIVSLSAMMTKENSAFTYVHKIIWFVFLIDVTIRFIKSVSKWKYIKRNPFDILSIIPLEDMFLLARFARFFKLFRYKNVLKRYLDRIDPLIKKIRFTRITLSMIFINSLIAIILFLCTSYSVLHSFIWTFRHFFQFNYTIDVTVVFLVILAILLKIGGVLYIGLLLNKIWTLLQSWYLVYTQKDKSI